MFGVRGDVLLRCLVNSRALVLAISPQNPYRSFNISGVNYGSMQVGEGRTGTRPTHSVAPVVSSSADGSSPATDCE